MHVEGEEDYHTVNWDTEDYDVINHPVVYEYEYDAEALSESEPDYLDFLPTSAFEKDLTFQELSAVDCATILETSPKLKEECPTDNEPCEAALAIAANIPTPELMTISRWRTFISTAYYHPNILAHGDVRCLKELFQLLGSDIRFSNANFMIDLEKSNKPQKPIINLRPALPFLQPVPVLTFAQIKEFTVEAELKTCIVTKYSIMDYIKGAVSELVQFIIEYPEALYLEMYGFVLDFFLRFGIQSDVIIDTVMRTQARRRKSQRPASVLMLRQANRLGKGKKEFLQKMLLSSPYKNYDPVVPIIPEPSPVRHLRNRKTGETFDDRTPNGASDVKPEIQTSTTTCDPVNIAANSWNSIATQTKKSVQGVPEKTKSIKRKLFLQETGGTAETAFARNRSGVGTLKKELYKSSSGQFLTRNKKRFYTRRDDSLLVKAFTCTICENRSFTYKGNLVVHMKNHHAHNSSNKPPSPAKVCVPLYSCPICLQRFRKINNCQRHIKKLHPDQADWDPLENEPEQAINNFTGRERRQCTLKPNERSSNKFSQDSPFPSTPASSCNHADSQNLPTSPLEPQQFNFCISSGLNFKIDSLSLSPIGHISVQQQHFRATVM